MLLAIILCFGLSPEVQSEIERLPGQQIEQMQTGYKILDIAGEGRPFVGHVHRQGDQLVLVSESVRLRLLGPLAHPRISGPGYKIWAIGDLSGDGLWMRRVGVLAAPP